MTGKGVSIHFLLGSVLQLGRGGAAGTADFHTFCKSQECGFVFAWMGLCSHITWLFFPD